MRGFTNLEDLPTNINLVSLTTLDLSGCSRLRTFPQLSTSIENLYLSDTATEEVPSWIESMAELTHLEMTRCEKLSSITWRLEIESICLGCRLKGVDFTDCGGVTSVSDASLVKTVAELYEEIFCSDSDIDYFCSYIGYFYSDSESLFHNCFNLDQDTQKFILQSSFRYAILPGKKVPTYFTDRTHGSCLTVSLPQSSLSQNHLGFTACMIIDINECPKNIIVHSKFRGVTRMRNTYPKISSSSMDHHHLLVFHFGFYSGEEVNDPPSQLDCNSVKFEFELHKDLQNCPISPSKMTVVTSQEPSSSLCDHSAVSLGSMAPNLELSLGLVGSSPRVSSRSKVPSPLTSSWNFHGDGPPLNLSLSSFDQCLEEECDPMITEQLDREIEDTSSFPQLTNYIR